MTRTLKYSLLFLAVFSSSCKKESDSIDWVASNYSGSYNNITYTESLIGEFTSGIYRENDLPGDLKHLEYGRIEIDFSYQGGGMNYFAPLMYYGSTNKDLTDDAAEEPGFHMAVEIGHYNVIPFPVEYLFYTICTFNQPQYCRDTYMPVFTGRNYTAVIDKKPEGMILQVKQGDTILNIFPHSFFPDSARMFFDDVTSYTDRNRGDSLEMVLMVGKGFAGIERGIHQLNGQVTSLRIYKYTFSDQGTGYELKRVRNQHSVFQKVDFSPVDHLSGDDKSIRIEYRFYPYEFKSGVLVPAGPVQALNPDIVPNSGTSTWYFTAEKTGFYRVMLQTLDGNHNVLRYSLQPFEIWVYPKEWEFEFY